MGEIGEKTRKDGKKGEGGHEETDDERRKRNETREIIW